MTISPLVWKTIGMGVTGVTGVVLLGLTQMFNVGINTNLFDTGIYFSAVLGIANIIISIAIYNNRV